MKFGLVHPSRGRVVQAEAAVREWAEAASGRHEYEHILTIDSDDDVAGYRALAERRGLELVVSANRTMVEATNRGAARATGDVIIVVSDDFGCPAGWDDALVAVITGRPRAAVLVHDDLHGRIMTLPILTRAVYDELGYVYHPAYMSMFADDDLTETVRALGVLVDARHLHFPHRHWFAGHAGPDATYLRQNAPRAWWHGWRVFEKRRLESFGQQPRGVRVRVGQFRIDLYYWVRTGLARARQEVVVRLGPAGRATEARLRDGALRWLRRVVGRGTGGV